MFPRTTRTLTLGLAGSAVLLTLYATTIWGTPNSETDQLTADANGQTSHTTSSHSYFGYRSRPWHYGWGWGSGYSRGSSVVMRSGGSTAGSHSSSHSVTSRGGFGHTGSAHASGS
ncbi:MAG: hypothetical protein ACJ8C4_02890 [Gemmataceae bacterium]